MDGPTVIIDLSPVVLLGEGSDWRNVERVVKAWREQKEPDAVFYGIADNSLWYKLDDYGQRRLSDWKKRRCARWCRLPTRRSWSLPRPIRMQRLSLRICFEITDDTSHGFRVYPANASSDQRFGGHVQSTRLFADSGLRGLDAVGGCSLKPKGITSPEARQELLYEWACADRTVPWGSFPVIDDDPAYKDGRVCCPKCLTPARKAGFRERTRQVVVLLGDDEADRIPIAEGTSIVVGRGRGEARYDVRSILADGPSRLVEP